MSLRNYLFLGGAIETTEDRAGRYRRATGALPDFSSRTPEVEPGLEGGEVTGRGGADLRRGAGVGLPGVSGLVVGSRAMGRRLPLWLEQVLLAVIRPGKNRRRGTRTVKAEAVQSELPFQRVRVVRNDLMTADVEVVPVRSGSGPAGPAGLAGQPGQSRLSAECRTRILRLWWDQGAERLKRLGGALR